jgi:hypothetical protein
MRPAAAGLARALPRKGRDNSIVSLNGLFDVICLILIFLVVDKK